MSDDLDAALDAAIEVPQESKTDPASVNWEWEVELPSGEIEYAAAVARPDQEELLFDLLYSSLCSSFEQDQRMQLFGILEVNARESDEFKAAEQELVRLSHNPQGPDWAVYGGVIPGYDAEGNPVIGVIQFYFKTEEVEATNGNEIRDGAAESNGEADQS